jgi:hypothetical protein
LQREELFCATVFTYPLSADSEHKWDEPLGSLHVSVSAENRTRQKNQDAGPEPAHTMIQKGKL